MSFINKAAKKTVMCASLFAATAFTALGQNPKQNTQPEPPPVQKHNPLRGTEFMILFKSFHSDRLTPYNENNFGIFAKKKVATWGGGPDPDDDGNDPKPEMSFMQGAYYNSNYTMTTTSGVLNEVTIGRTKVGLLAGIALYPRVEKDVVTYSTIYSMDTPKKQRKRGHSTTYIPTAKPYEYTVVEKQYKARGLKNKFRIIPALLATFSYNAHKGSGPFGIVTFVPWKSGEDRNLFIFAAGVRINADPQPR